MAEKSGYAETSNPINNRYTDVDRRDGENLTPLHDAASENDAAACEALIKRGADIEAMGGRENSVNALHWAAMFDAAAAAAVLLRHGANVAATTADVDDYSPLQLAAQFNAAKTAAVLLEYGANVDEVQSGDPPLQCAVKNGAAAVCEILLQHGAALNNPSAWPPIVEAASCDQAEIIELLVRYGADPNMREWRGSTPLHIAARFNKAKAAAALIACGADIDAEDKEGRTPLEAVIADGCDCGECCAVLIAATREKGDENLQSQLDNLLETAARNSLSECCRALLTAGAALDSGKIGFSTFVLAAGAYRTESISTVVFSFPRDRFFRMKKVLKTCQVLLEYGADVNARENPESGDGPTALHFAVAHGCIPLVNFLLEHGADANIDDVIVGAPLHIAAEYGYDEIIKILLAHGTPVDILWSAVGVYTTPLHSAASIAGASTVEILLAHGADINARGERGLTPLHCAACCGNADTAKILIAHGAELQAVDEDGRTPLAAAKQYECLEIAEMIERQLLSEEA